MSLYCFIRHDMLKTIDRDMVDHHHSVEGQKYCVHIRYVEESTKKAICAKKLKGLNNFF